MTPHAYARDIHIPFSVTRVIDGDTFSVSIELWPNLNKTVNIRIRGVDTPEVYGYKCTQEKQLALKAKKFLEEALSSENVIMEDIQLGTYAGRVIATIIVNGQDIKDIMITKKIGRHYTGNSKKHSWC